MNRMLMALLLTAGVAVGSAHAQWVYQRGEDDPFKGGAEHIALAISGDGFMAGFRCTSPADATLMLITQEKPKGPELLALAVAKVRLLVIVDAAAKIVIPADIEVTPDGERFRVAGTGSLVAEVAHAAAAAKQRVALAGEIEGRIAWSKAFPVQGSRRALQPLLDGCKLPPPSSR